MTWRTDVLAVVALLGMVAVGIEGDRLLAALVGGVIGVTFVWALSG